MSESAEIHKLMDAYLASLRKRGSTYKRRHGGPGEADVRELLSANGYEVREDVVGFFTWSQFAGEDDPLFWETHAAIALTAAISMHRQGIEIRDEVLAGDFSTGELLWWPPGPDFLLPVAVTDAKEYVAVDCRPDPIGGAVYFQFTEAEVIKLFDSLADAIAGATWCVEMGIWTVGEYSAIESLRGTMPGSDDYSARAPWASYHDEPTVHLYDLEEPQRYLSITDGGQTRLVTVAQFVAEQLLDSGCSDAPMSWAEVRELDRGDYREIERARESPTSDRYGVVRLEPTGSYVSVYHPRKGSYTQWLDPEQTALVRDQGIEFDEATGPEAQFYMGLGGVHRLRHADRPLTEIIEVLKSYFRSC